jgi:excisionase family DNA binding protein
MKERNVEKELLGAMVPMMGFKKEIYDFVNGLIKEKLKENKVHLFTVEEASIKLNIKVSRLRQAIFRREISYVKLGALVRFREEDLTNFVQKNIKNVN